MKIGSGSLRGFWGQKNSFAPPKRVLNLALFLLLTVVEINRSVY